MDFTLRNSKESTCFVEIIGFVNNSFRKSSKTAAFKILENILGTKESNIQSRCLETSTTTVCKIN